MELANDGMGNLIELSAAAVNSSYSQSLRQGQAPLIPIVMTVLTATLTCRVWLNGDITCLRASDRKLRQIRQREHRRHSFVAIRA